MPLFHVMNSLTFLSGPIEKGAIDGQTTYGNDLVKALKTAITARALGTAKGGKVKRPRKQSEAVGATAAAAANAAIVSLDSNKGKTSDWGVFEPVHGLLGPVVGILKPFWSASVAISIIAFLLYLLYSRRLDTPSSRSDLQYGRPSLQYSAAYEDLWRAEENELWQWLENRIGMEGISFPNGDSSQKSANLKHQPRNSKQKDRSTTSKIDAEQISQREMKYAIQIVRDRLDKLEEIVSSRNGNEERV